MTILSAGAGGSKWPGAVRIRKSSIFVENPFESSEDLKRLRTLEPEIDLKARLQKEKAERKAKAIERSRLRQIARKEAEAKAKAEEEQANTAAANNDTTIKSNDNNSGGGESVTQTNPMIKSFFLCKKKIRKKKKKSSPLFSFGFLGEIDRALSLSLSPRPSPPRRRRRRLEGTAFARSSYHHRLERSRLVVVLGFSPFFRPRRERLLLLLLEDPKCFPRTNRKIVSRFGPE